ncbi:hypothetical protein HBN76_04540 [Pseudomonas sp. WS 5013]|uniref:hypothetical protein n=1 Tax=Pseudomonas sp. WS 5013 TaxID=2717475 RepID=UPI0014752913|nr:hypothetical protein [Pseudomonas sp. WS 5013]NMY40566.1 hypothetical protein [Pseudomonas sp. WS 5013]
MQIWNAWLEPLTLEGIAGIEEGVLLTGHPAPPMLIAALEELVWQVAVTPDGQPVLDTVLEWSFNNGDIAGVRVTANRIIAWSFVPDWKDGVVESLEWLTDILTSETAVEQRRALRLAPRREFEAQMYVEGSDRRLLDMMLYGWGTRVWALPIWHEIQLLQVDLALGAQRIDCATQYLDFESGGLAMLRGETAFEFEVVEVATLDAGGLNLTRPTQSAWPRGSRLYPVRPAQLLEQPALTRLTDQAMAMDVRFRLSNPSNWPAVLPATLYRGFPVLEQRPDENEDLTSSFERLTQILDSGMSMPLLSTTSRALPVQGWRWLELGRAARATLRSMLYGLRGRQVPVWVPTHADDLQLVAPVNGAAIALDVANIAYTRFGQARPGRRDIRIELVNGTVFHRRITGSTEMAGGIERLAIDSALGQPVDPSQVFRISWLVLSRGNSDRVDIEHQTDSEGVASCALTFRGVRDDEF